MKIKKAESEFVQPKTGLTQGVINRIIDLGTQEDEYKGEIKKKRKLMIEFALPKQTHTFDEEKGPEMLTISRFFTASLHPMAGLRNFMQDILNATINEDAFDTADYLGLNCMVNIVPHEKQNGEIGTKIASASPLMEGIDSYPAPNPLDFSLESYTQEQWDSLSEGIQNMIKKSPEYTPFSE